MSDLSISSLPGPVSILASSRNFLRLAVERLNAVSRFGILALAVVGLVGCSSAPLPTAPDPVADQTPYKLGPGDKVQVHVFGDDNLSGERQVDGSGVFTFPLIGAVQASGLTSSELEGVLEKKLKEYMREPNVSVEILTYRPFYIVGEVRRPGSYSFVDGMTVMNAVAIAGGFTYRAQERDFQIQRANTKDRMGAGQATRLAPGDVVIVRERFF